MGKKLYEETNGGIRFKSKRRPWEVRVPNYVYDLWLPVLGVVALGIYQVYCRLEREGVVKAITLGRIARACRIGKSRLYAEHKKLERCGFIEITPPTSWHRLAHHTTEIVVLDPPQEVPAWVIEEYVQTEQGYQPLSPWLVEDKQEKPLGVPNGTPEGPKQDVVDVPNGTPNVETLGLKPLDVVPGAKKSQPPVDYLSHCAEVAKNQQQGEREWSVAGNNGLVSESIAYLYELLGSTPPKEGSGTWRRVYDKIEPVLRERDVKDIAKVRTALARFREDNPVTFKPFYKSFADELDAYLGELDGKKKPIEIGY